MTPAQQQAIEKAVNDYKLKAELIRAEYQKQVRTIIESAKARRIAEIKKSLHE